MYWDDCSIIDIARETPYDRQCCHNPRLLDRVPIATALPVMTTGRQLPALEEIKKTLRPK
jgi:hypothetical protein